MSVIVRDDGFHAEDYTGDAVLDIAQDTAPDALPKSFNGIELIRVEFPAFSNGRGFTLAKLLRQYGYTGRLRAKGPVLSDQYAMARRLGFDEVEIPDELAARQPAGEWIFRADWREHDYRSQIRA
ncbi:MAG TPA: DUF934 domain-containing protein [Albidovulum sp.]|uniref:DUF934 domain-containing protein n=1 Tax=Albidovulum sp. TaxID=1872424 RepID=UPI002D1886A3|nr:DUF934 domain-containing protein [Albidovulum sp.]